ncbi:unnamed protein product [Chrysoparadoxa australica]
MDLLVKQGVKQGVEALLSGVGDCQERERRKREERESQEPEPCDDDYVMARDLAMNAAYEGEEEMVRKAFQRAVPGGEMLWCSGVASSLGVNGFIAAYDKTMLVVLRGSQNTGDWRSNFNIAQTQLGQCHSLYFSAVCLGETHMAHAGFLEAEVSKQTYVAACEVLAGARGGSGVYDRVLLAGHSRGGAIANLITWRLHNGEVMMHCEASSLPLHFLGLIPAFTSQQSLACRPKNFYSSHSTVPGSSTQHWQRPLTGKEA